MNDAGGGEPAPASLEEVRVDLMVPTLELRQVSKHYPGVQALADASFSVARGSVHGLLGENGAGKSTVVNIVCGVTTPDSGQVLFAGESVRLRNPHDAVRHGVGVVHQELSLIPSLSIQENVLLGHIPRRASLFVDWIGLGRQARAALASVGLSVDPSTLAGALPTSAQQQVEIARALASNPSLLVMDEPTSALTSDEVDRLFGIVRGLCATGLSVLFISHRFEEVWRICDEITILRGGQVVLTQPTAELEYRAAAKAMIGHALARQEQTSTVPSDIGLLDVVHLSTDKLRDVNLSVREGEVVGVAGALGAGKSELLRALFGTDPSARGEVFIGGERVVIGSPQAAMRHGVFLVPDDRKRDGAVMGMSVADNITLPYLGVLSVAGFIDRKRQNGFVEAYVKRLGIRISRTSQRLLTLSGGNQQKVVLARWLSLQPRVLLLDEPTRGLDVGAKEEIYALIHDLSSAGVGILVAPSEVAELFRICHRICVLRDGSVSREFDAATSNEDDIVLAAHASEATALTGSAAVGSGRG